MATMGCEKNGFILRLCLSLLAVMILLSSAACGLKDIKSDIQELIIKNRTDEVLSIYIDGIHVFEIEPGKEKTAPVRRTFSLHLTAKNAQAEIVFSQEITDEQVVNSGITRGKHYAYIVVISALYKGGR